MKPGACKRKVRWIQLVQQPHREQRVVATLTLEVAHGALLIVRPLRHPAPARQTARVGAVQAPGTSGGGSSGAPRAARRPGPTRRLVQHSGLQQYLPHVPQRGERLQGLHGATPGAPVA
jgi:hypothetical protein